VIAGMAEECSGPAGLPAHPVAVIVRRGNKIVAQQASLGSYLYRFSLPPGNYLVTTDQSYVVPAQVSLRPNQVVHADLISACS
jgi:hypothetical protein